LIDEFLPALRIVEVDERSVPLSGLTSRSWIARASSSCDHDLSRAFAFDSHSETAGFVLVS